MAVADHSAPGLVPVCRRAGTDDELALAALVRDHYGGDLTARRARMRRSLERGDGCVFLAEHDGEVVGYGRGAWCEPRGAQDEAPAGLYLTGVVVAPAWQRRGVATMLTRACLA